MNTVFRLIALTAIAGAAQLGSPSGISASEPKTDHASVDAANSHEAAKPAHSGGDATGHGSTDADAASGGEAHTVQRELSYASLPQGDDQPWKLVRNLQRLQDGIAGGETSKVDEYRFEINRVGRILSNAGSQVWQVQRNLDAAAMLLMFGGDVEVGRRALHDTQLGEMDKAPLQAAVDYRQSNFRDASKYFAHLNLETLPPSMRAQFAFIAGVVYGNSDAKSAEKQFDNAALLAPGTLVEEASLRRLMAIAGLNHDAEKLGKIARQYTDRFANSPYYGDFVRNFYLAAIAMPESEFDKVEEKLQFVIDRLPDEKRLEIMTVIAEKAVGFGRLKLAMWAAGGALPLARDNSARQQRLRLYLAAAKLPTVETFDEGRALLDTIQRDRLNQDHRQLFDALTYLVKGVIAPPATSPGALSGVDAAPESAAYAPREASGESVPQGSQNTPDPADYPEMARDTLQKRDALLSEIDKLDQN